MSLTAALGKPFGWRLGKAFLPGELGGASLLEEKSGVSPGEQELLRWIFTFFTPPGKHILTSFQCSVLSFNSSTYQLKFEQCLIVKCDERQGRPQGPGTFLLCSSLEMLLLQCLVDTPEV